MKKNKHFRNTRILVLGANSDVAKALGRMLADEGARLILASRNMEELEAEAAHLRLTCDTDVEVYPFDARKTEDHAGFYRSLDPAPDGVVLAFGYLGDQKRAEADPAHAREIMEINYLGAVFILEIIADDFERRGTGFIAAISSVAGVRGRAANYYYGSAKAGFTAWLSGLRQRLQPAGIPVLTVLPGYIATKMIAGQKTPGPLTASPEQVARAMIKAIRSQKETIYVTSRWRLIMAVIRLIPEKIFKRMKI